MSERKNQLEARITAIEEKLAAQEARAAEQLERLRNPRINLSDLEDTKVEFTSRFDSAPNEAALRTDIETGDTYFKGDITVREPKV